MVARRSRVIRELPDEANRLLGRFEEPIRVCILELRARVLGVAPNVHEVLADVGYTISIRFGPDDRVKTSFVYITGFTKHTNLGFLNGASMKDRNRVLEGDGAAMRHVKFRSVDEIRDAAWLDRYLAEALSVKGLDRSIGDGHTEVRVQRRKRK